MSGQPAARVGDFHVCPKVEPGPVPHVGGPILPPGAPTVLIGGQPAARMNDMAVCVGPPDTINKGAFPVPIEQNPASRLTDTTAHGGVIVIGYPTVLIGLAGTTGNVLRGTEACQDAASGRTSGATQQSYNNCGVESTRQLINHTTGANVTEDGLLTSAINSGDAVGTAGGPLTVPDGGTWPNTQANILTTNGVPAATASAADPNTLQLAMSRGQGVVANVDAAALWPTTAGITPGAGSYHAITVVGIEYDDAGNMTNVIINDTGTGQCGVTVPANTFNNALGAYHTPNQGLVVTSNPIWR